MDGHRGSAGRRGAGRDRYRSISPDLNHHFNSSKYPRGRPEPPISNSDELNHHRDRDNYNNRHHRRGSPGRRYSPPPPLPVYNNGMNNYRRSPGRRNSPPPPPPRPAFNNYRGGDRDRDRDRDRERDREYRRAAAFDSPAELPLPPPPPPRRYSPLRAGVGGGGSTGFHSMSPLSGQKRHFSSFSEDTRGPLPLPPPPPPPVAVPERNDGDSITKLFVGSVPRTVTEEDIRPLFDKHGRVIEVALITDKRTGQQQGCCFVKYATSQEADTAIKMLHNQHTLPGGTGPIQVRYADGERERLGTVEFKLFVGSLNKHATEKEIEQIFAPYGQVADVYLMRDEMKLSRGCGFVKYKHREMALAAINALNGKYTMPGCFSPMTVRFADPKRPKPELRGGTPVLGGPGPGPHLPSPLIRPPLMQGEPMHARFPPNAWQPMSPQKPGIPNSGLPGFGNHFQPGTADMPGSIDGSSGCSTSTSLAGNAVSSTSTTQLNHGQSFPSLPSMPSVGQHVSPRQKPLQSPPRLPFPLQLQPPNTVQPSVSHPMIRPVSQAMFPSSVGQTLNQPLPSQLLPGSAGHFPAPQPLVPLNASSALEQGSRMSNFQPHTFTGANQQQLAAQPSFQPPQQPSHLAQLLSQQRQTLQASFQSSQQAVSQLQQQLQLRQASNQSLMPQQGPLPAKDQSQWSGTAPQTVGNALTVQPGTGTVSVNSATPSTTSDVTPSKCDWTEHTSPDGYKYYHNSTTGESKWDKPKELELHEQQQQQKPPVQYPQMQHFQNPPVQSVLQRQNEVQNQNQSQPQSHNRPQLQLSSSSSMAPGAAGHQNFQELRYTQPPVITGPKSANDPARFQQVQQPAAQDWKWKNNSAGM